MRGIIYKDLCDNFLVWKNLVSYFFYFVIIVGGAILSNDSAYSFILLLIMLSLIGASAIESSAEQEEAADFDRLLISFPIKKEEVVIAKYVLSLIFIAVGSAMSLVITVLHVLTGGVLDFSQGLPIWGLGVCLSLIFAGVSYIGYMLFGKRKGTILYVLLVVIFAGIYGSMQVIFGIERFVQMDKTPLLLAGLPISVFVFAASCMISIRIYKKKFS